VELTDLLGDEGLVVPELSARLQARLAEFLPGYASPRNPVDMTPDWARFAQLYPSCLEALAGSGEVDMVVLILLQRSALDPAVARAVVDATGPLGGRLPVYVCWVAPRQALANAEVLQSARIPCLEWPERTARALGHAVRYGRRRAKARPSPAVEQPPPGAPGKIPSLAPGVVAPGPAAELMAALGIDVPAQVLCADAEAAVTAAGQVGYPVVAKLVSDRFVHKSDAGGVRLDLAGEADVRAAAREMLELDPAGQVLVQERARGQEVVIGGFRDAQLGPVVMAGLGGLFVEVLADAVFRVAPVDEEEAAEAWRELRGYAVLSGVRGRPGVDLAALARTLAAVSRLMVAVPQIVELDLNPVMASPERTTAVDIRIVVSSA
jgi:acetyltransferase